MEKKWKGKPKIFLDSAPVIYFVEQHPEYYALLEPIFALIDHEELEAIVSPVTFAECLVVPCRLNLLETVNSFVDFMENSNSLTFSSILPIDAYPACEFRVRYNLTLLDALQICVAIRNQCDYFLTNDKRLRRISELKILTKEDWGIPLEN